MKALLSTLLVSTFMVVAAPAFAEPDMEAIQIFDCEFTDDGTTDQLLEVADEWLKAAQKTKGGKNMGLAIRFPIAEGEAGDGDFRFVIVFDTFTNWGEFTDAYEGSAVAKVDDKLNELADCGYSTMWEGLRIK